MSPSDCRQTLATGTTLAEKGTAAPLTKPPAWACETQPSLEDEQQSAAGAVDILVLAVDRLNAKVYGDLLEARGHRAMVAQNYRGWVGALDESPPHLVLIDLCASDHPSNDIMLTITNEPRFGSIPMIAITEEFTFGALGASGDIATVVARCAGRIAKPISVAGFYAPIDACLAQAATGVSNRSSLVRDRIAV